MLSLDRKLTFFTKKTHALKKLKQVSDKSFTVMAKQNPCHGEIIYEGITQMSSFYNVTGE